MPAPSPVKVSPTWKLAPPSMEYSKLPPVATTPMTPPEGWAQVGSVTATSSMTGGSGASKKIVVPPAAQPLLTDSTTGK